MNLQFYKYQATGNDFIIINNHDNLVALTQQQVNALCDRRFGIGADGLMLMNAKPGYDFDMIYYNADGNLGTMCGNGGRCLIKFALDTGMHKKEYSFTAVDGKHTASIEEDGIIRLKMNDVNGVEISAGSDFILNTGSPHYVKPVPDTRQVNVVKEGRSIRYSDRFASEGINVNFVMLNKQGGIDVRTYERGVEDETLSCGTGVTASALVFANKENGLHHINVQTPGGNLYVEFLKTGAAQFSDIWLCGPAAFVFKGEIES